MFNKKKTEENKVRGKELSYLGVHTDVSEEDLNRLVQTAGGIVAMFENVCKDKMERLKLVSGLAGYACHQAVKANGGAFVNVETTDGLMFYFGDAVNYYLLEGEYNMFMFLKGFYDNKDLSPEEIDINTPIRKATENVGNNDYLIWDKHTPVSVYKEVKDCWEGIYQNMTSRICTKPSEWPVLFSIVLQNVMFMCDTEPKDTLLKAIECALFISKMDEASIDIKAIKEKEEEKLYTFYEHGKPMELKESDKEYVRSSVDVIKDFLNESNIVYDVSDMGSEAKVFSINTRINNQQTTVYVGMYLVPKLCRIELRIPVEVDKSKEAELCLKLTKFNYNTRFGGVVYNADKGELYYKIVFPCSEGLKKDNFVGTFLYAASMTSKFMDEN